MNSNDETDEKSNSNDETHSNDETDEKCNSNDLAEKCNRESSVDDTASSVDDTASSLDSLDDTSSIASSQNYGLRPMTMLLEDYILQQKKVVELTRNMMEARAERDSAEHKHRHMKCHADVLHTDINYANVKIHNLNERVNRAEWVTIFLTVTNLVSVGMFMWECAAPPNFSSNNKI
jgi:hypothetical protein